MDTKSDATPVTIADRDIESAMRTLLEKQRPQDGIWGEEFGKKPSQSGLTWVLDPIDGTKPFICGRPTFGTLIALCDERGVPILGIIDQPVLRDRWLGVKGEPTLWNGQAVRTKPCKTLKEAVSTSTAPGMFDRFGAGFIPRWREAVRFISWGGDCTSYGLLANGHVDLIIEACMQPYDYLANVPIVEGAGGKICDFEGQPLTLHSADHVVAMGDSALWPSVQDIVLR